MTFEPKMEDDATAKFTFTAKNKSQETRTVIAKFTALATYYTGVTADELKKSKETFILQAGEGDYISCFVR
jgi:hypothetical protein